MRLAAWGDDADQIVVLERSRDAAVSRDQLAVEALGEGDVQGVVEAEVVAQLPGPRRDRPMDRVAAGGDGQGVRPSTALKPRRRR